MNARMSDAPFTLRHVDELERSGRWLLARRSLGLESFGLNLVDVEPGDRIRSTTRRSATRRRSTSSSAARRRR
jgi:uncharacterized cupin superfamily protein